MNVNQKRDSPSTNVGNLKKPSKRRCASSDQSRQPEKSKSRKLKVLNTLSNPSRKPIKRVWQLYEDGQIGWIKGELAINAAGHMEDIRSPHVTGCCLIGAIHRVYGRNIGSLYKIHENIEPEVIVRKVAMRVKEPCLWKWNDRPSTTLHDVIAICKELDI